MMANASYIKKQTKLHGEINPEADNNWTFYGFKSSNKSKVILSFETSPVAKADRFISEKSIYSMTKVGLDNDSFAVYQFNLQKK